MFICRRKMGETQTDGLHELFDSSDGDEAPETLADLFYQTVETDESD